MTTPSNLHSFPARAGAKVGIAIDLDHLRRLMREFTIEQEPDADERVSLDLTFEIFLQWLRKRMETTNGA
jgi:hypothetical protein